MFQATREVHGTSELLDAAVSVVHLTNQSVRHFETPRCLALEVQTRPTQSRNGRKRRTMHCGTPDRQLDMVSRYGTAWAESLEGAMSGHQSWAVLGRFRCRLLLAEIPKGVDRNSELKHRLQVCETAQISVLIFNFLGQQNPGQLRRTARSVQTQPDEQREKRAFLQECQGNSAARRGLGAREGGVTAKERYVVRGN